MERVNPNAFELVAKNTLGNSTFASRALVGNKIYTRVRIGNRGTLQEWLVCIGNLTIGLISG